MTYARTALWLCLAVVLASCAGKRSDVPRDEVEDDAPPLLAQHFTYRIPADLAVVAARIDAQLTKCSVRQLWMYTPLPIPYGETYVSRSTVAGAATGRVLFSQRGVQSFVVYQFDLQQLDDHVTRVDLGMRARKEDPALLRLWLEGLQGCRAD